MLNTFGVAEHNDKWLLMTIYCYLLLLQLQLWLNVMRIKFIISLLYIIDLYPFSCFFACTDRHHGSSDSTVICHYCIFKYLKGINCRRLPWTSSSLNFATSIWASVGLDEAGLARFNLWLTHIIILVTRVWMFG